MPVPDVDAEAWKRMVLRSMPAPAWLSPDAPHNDVVLSSRARFMRNLTGFRFPHMAPQSELIAVLKKVLAAAQQSGLGFEVVTRKDQLPCLYQWQNFQPGNYTMGIEPSTHHVLGNLAARERGEMIFLEHAESRSYDSVFRVLDGADAIKAAEARIRGIAVQPSEDFPKPSNDFPSLGGRS